MNKSVPLILVNLETWLLKTKILERMFYLKLGNNGVFLLISKRDRDRRVHERTHQNAEE